MTVIETTQLQTVTQ